MPDQEQPKPNVRQAVPLFGITDMPASLRFHVEGLGIVVKIAWRPDGPDIRWC